MQNECAAPLSTAASYKYLLMTIVVGLHFDVISCELARRCVRRGTDEVSGSDGVQRVWEQ